MQQSLEMNKRDQHPEEVAKAFLRILSITADANNSFYISKMNDWGESVTALVVAPKKKLEQFIFYTNTTFKVFDRIIASIPIWILY